jgi:hypothetical protein
VWAFETTTDGKVLAKLGDGEHRWNDLKYFDGENIHGLPEELQSLAQTISDETARAQAAEQLLRQDIDGVETFHDDTLSGKGTESEPLSVRGAALGGINAGVTLVPDGVETVFQLPDDFVTGALSLVTVNGLVQAPGADYALDAGAKTITFFETPETGDAVRACYVAAL